MDAFAVLTVRPDGEHDDTCPEHLTDKDLDDLKLTFVAKVIAMSTPREYMAYYKRMKALP